MAKKLKPKKAPEKLPEFIDRLELKHSFSDAEKAQLLNALSRKHEEKAGLISQAKSSAKQWKNKIDEVQLKLDELSTKGRDGFEMRPTDVRVVLDKKRKKKTLYRQDNGDLIEERDMSEFDFERLPMTLPTPTPAPIKPGEGIVSVADAVAEAEKEPAVNSDTEEDANL